MITIFTPIYNRVDTITRLYESLCHQTCKDFEWLIVDDGSTDGLEELIDKFCAEKLIRIRFYRQPNQGKHIAVNKGVSLAEGKYFYIVDSDDYLPTDAVEFINNKLSEIDNKPEYGGIIGMDETIEGKVLCRRHIDNYIDATTFDLRFKYKIECDRADIVRTELMRKYPYPNTLGEKYSAPSYVYNLIANEGYIFRIFPNIIKKIEYLPNGISSANIKWRMVSPVNATSLYSQLVQMNIPYKQKIKAAINYWRFRYCSKNKDIARLPLYWVWTAVFGYFLHMKDVHKFGKVYKQ